MLHTSPPAPQCQITTREKLFPTTQVTSDYTQWNGTPKDIYQRGFWQPAMGTAGGRPDIGPFPDWVVRWLYTGDYARTADFTRQRGLGALVASSDREGASGKTFDKARNVDAMGRVLSISARPSVDFSQGWRQPSATTNDKINPVGPVTCFNCGVWKWDSAHLPDAFFVPYLLTGDFFYSRTIVVLGELFGCLSCGKLRCELWTWRFARQRRNLHGSRAR